MLELVRTIAEALVDHPKYVQVKEVGDQHCRVIELYVAKEDVGKVIGKRGVHVEAIRTIVCAAGGKLKKRYVLELIEHNLPSALNGDPVPQLQKLRAV